MLWKKVKIKSGVQDLKNDEGEVISNSKGLSKADLLNEFF